MRERMLQLPGVPEQINRDTVPVQVNITDLGFPEEVECLQWWKDQYGVNPWTRMIYGHFVVMNGEGSKVYGTSGCQCIETMKYGEPFKFGKFQFDHAVTAFKQSRELEKIEKRSVEQEERLMDIYRKMNHQVHVGRLCGEDMRLLTARFLVNHGAQSWKTVLGQLMTPKPGQNEADPLGERMRISATRRLGEFVSDDSPFVGAAAEHLVAIYKQAGVYQFAEVRAKILEGKDVDYVLPEEVPMPPSLIREAAFSLGLIVGENWQKDDPELVAKAAAWWLKHEGEERFQLPEAKLAKKSESKKTF